MSQFRIDEKISESGSTSVYKAFQEALDRPVLLKVLHQHLANDPVIRERFSREAKACAHLRSEHIVQVYDLTEYNGCPAIVMEYVHGSSLKDVIAGIPADRENLATSVAVSILQALSLAHRRGIIHRDIKPGNILVADDGTVKLTDFGLAYVAHAPTVTLEGTVLGTPAYMAPEQVRGETVDARTDFFSLGVTLVEVVTGKRIFEGPTYSECIRKIMEFRAEHLEGIVLSLPPDRLAFLKRLMAPEAKNRFQNATEALNDLGEKAEETQSESQERPPRRYLVPALTVLAALAFVGVLYFGTPKPSPTGQRQDPIRQTQTQDSSTVAGGDVQAVENRRPVEQRPGAVFDPKSTDRQSPQLPSMSARVDRDSANIVFTSNPWAKVYVDGRLVGETPLAQPVVLAQGKHSVTFSNPSFDPILKDIEIRSGKQQIVSADFLANAGFLKCTVEPWAEVYVDEQYKDTTPLGRPIIVTAGIHHLRFHNSAYVDSMQVITVRPRDTVTVVVTLKTLR